MVKINIHACFLKKIENTKFCNPSRMVSFFIVAGGSLGQKNLYYRPDKAQGRLPVLNQKYRLFIKFVQDTDFKLLLKASGKGNAL